MLLESRQPKVRIANASCEWLWYAKAPLQRTHGFASVYTLPPERRSDANTVG